MADLRKAARGRECQVRIPGICNGNPETSVLAHIRLAGLCGTGIKPPDLIATMHVLPATTKSTAAHILSMLHMQKNARWKVWREHRLSG